MNLAIRGLAADLGKEPGDTFGNDQHPDTKFEYIIANPLLMFLTGVERSMKMILGGYMADLQWVMLTMHGYNICYGNLGLGPSRCSAS